MTESTDEKNLLITELTDKASRLWGLKRTNGSSNNIIEAADHILKVNGAEIDDDETPLFHPSISGRTEDDDHIK